MGPVPHLFRQRGLVSDVPFVGIPEVSSEGRAYLSVAHFESDVIVSNKVYGVLELPKILSPKMRSHSPTAWS
nr:type IIL restriction-modification enzyme MmeI [Micrococcus sp. KRD153]